MTEETAKVFQFSVKDEDEKALVWVCPCGSQLFYIVRGGMECATCGEMAEGWE